MWPLSVLVVSKFLLLFSARCHADNVEKLYQDFMEEVVNIKDLGRAIRDTVPGIDDEVALTMLDASAKIPVGLMAGNMYDFGHFDECYRIKSGDVYGKYCLGSVVLNEDTKKYFDGFKVNLTPRRQMRQVHPEPRVGDLGQALAGIRMGICMPSNMSFEALPGLLRYDKNFCYSKATDPGLSRGAVATIVVLAIFIAIAVMSTLFDLFLYYTEKKSPHELLIAFSFLTNGRKIFASTTNPNQLLCLNGMRAISMMWVILGHEYSIAWDGSAPLYNFVDVETWQHDWANMIINGADVSVDTFFAIGGLVTVYTFLRSMDKGTKFNLVLFYVHRYLRLTPAFAVMTFFHMFLVEYTANGPVWRNLFYGLTQNCHKDWWSGLLYITNYVREGNCVPQAWYLSVDMQLFLLSPLVLVPLHRWKKLTLAALGLLSVAGCAVPFALAYHFGWGPGMNNWNEFNDYYVQTHTRFGPYVIGMILGYILYKVKKDDLTVKMPKLVACGCWLVCLTGMAVCVYANFPLNVATEEARWPNAAYTGLNRSGWTLFLCGVIFLCVTGQGHPVDKFLSFPIFQFLGKVSYSMYLVHYAIINVRYAAMKNPLKFSNSAFYYAFWADFMVTLGFAVILSLMFESPIIILEKYIFGRGATKRSNLMRATKSSGHN